MKITVSELKKLIRASLKESVGTGVGAAPSLPEPEDVKEKMGVRPDQIVDYLSILGDSSDNIPGMKGIGAVGAAKLLEEYGTLDNIIANRANLKIGRAHV